MWNIPDTAKWGLGIILVILGQTFAGGWYLATLSAQVQQNKTIIAGLQSRESQYITRAQIEDILGGRDQRLTSIENTLDRLEAKFDKTFGK